MAKRKTSRKSIVGQLVTWIAEDAAVVAEGQEEGVAEAAEGGAPGTKLPTYSMVAYTGGPLQVNRWVDPLVIAFDGLEIPSQILPTRLNHDANKGVGNTTRIWVAAGKLKAEGVVSRDTLDAREFVTSAMNGFPWKASVTARVMEEGFVEAGATTKVNGKVVRGPASIALQARLMEISVLDIAADANTSVKVAASGDDEGDDDMAKKKGVVKTEGTEEGLQAGGEGGDDPNPTETTPDADTGDQGGSESPAPAPTPSEAKIMKASQAAAVNAAAVQAQVEMAAKSEEAIQAHRKKIVEEDARVAAIQELCAAAESPEIGKQAILEGWDLDKTELMVFRAARPKAPAIHSPESAMGVPEVLEAACMVAGRYDSEKLVGLYGEKTLDAADKRFGRAISLQELLLEAAWAQGYRGTTAKNLREVLRFAFTPSDRSSTIEAAWSNSDIAGILGNVANKFLLKGFDSVEQAWREITTIRSVKDFKQVTSYRLTGVEEYDLVAPGGEITHGTLAEESFTNQAATYAKMLAITREDIINDDLGALTAVPFKLGRGSGLKINDIFWTEFVSDHGSFFFADNNNLVTSNALADETNLTAAEVVFMDLLDPQSKPMGHMPKIILVPTALANIASRFFVSAELRGQGEDAAPFPVSNPHAGKFRPTVSRYLGHASYGNSATSWYILADPMDLSVIETCFLNGQEAPTIESADADFNQLGIQFRGYHDFGVNKQDARAGVKSTA